jgi:hypothetical protein
MSTEVRKTQMADFLSFDIEISDIIILGGGEDIDNYAPFHVSVAASAIYGSEERLWYSEDEFKKPRLHITPSTANSLLNYLWDKQEQGYKICAWNGLRFDIRWIGHAASNLPLAAKIALKMYDPMFQFFSQRGFPIKLAAVARAMGIKQCKLMDGADAPKEWHAGQFQKVMDYVLCDCQITNLVIQQILDKKSIAWITQKGERKTEPIHLLKTVEEILKEPEPDQSWMSQPISRRSFIEWLREVK